METVIAVKNQKKPGRKPAPENKTKNKAGLAALLGSSGAADLSGLMSRPATGSEPAPTPEQAQERTEKQIRQRFYYLHEQLKKRYRVDVKSKTIYVNDFEKIPIPYSEYVEELRLSGYSIQQSAIALLPDATIGKQKIKQIARLYAGALLSETDLESIALENISGDDRNRLAAEIKLIAFELTHSVTTTPPAEKTLQAAINYVLKIKVL
jgi:hypothetical protein